MTGPVGPAVRYGRLAALTGALVLLVPLLVTGSVSAPLDSARAAAAEPGDAPAADTGRIVFAGTEHRSLGRVTATDNSAPLFGTGQPTHFDQQPSARGDLLVFTSLRDGARPQVYLRVADGSVRRLTTGLDAQHPELSPDGTTVVFDAVDTDAAEDAPRDLWTVRTDGSGPRRLTDSAADEVSPTFSPDGTRIAYSSDSDPARGRQIYERALSGGPERRISDAPAGNATEPSWNPVDDDAHRDLVAFTLQTGGGPGEELEPRLWVTDGKGGDRAVLTGGPAEWSTKSPAWLPDGGGLLFLSPDQTCSCDPFDNVYRVRTETYEAPELLLNENRAVDSPTWLGPAAAGSVVVARTSGASPHKALLLDMRQDGSDPRNLGMTLLKEDPASETNTDPAVDPLFDPAEGFDPWTERQSYTPDGRRIVVTRFEDTEAGRIQRIWRVDADGANPEAMPLAGRGPLDRDTDPAFSPDGNRIAFTRVTPGADGDAPATARVLVADAVTGAITDEVVPPAGQARGGDAQPTWSPDGGTIAFTRNQVIDGLGGNKHVWTAPADDLGRQQDLTAEHCPGPCDVIDDSPAFSPDGLTLAFNRKDGGGRVNERTGVVVTSVTGAGCQVVLPAALRGDPGACGRALPDTSATGPFQPRDVAWSPDGSRLLLSARRALAPNAPEALSALDIASGELTPLTSGLPGRQKEPAYQQSVDLAVTAPPTGPRVEEGASTSLTVTVTNHGPSPSPRTTFTADAPPGVRIDTLTTPSGPCPVGSPQCDLGVLAPGASVPVTVEVTGVTTGEHRIGWSVAGSVVDPGPGDNAADTVVPVDAVTPPPTPTPTPTDTPAPPSPTPTPPAPAPAPPAPAPPAAGPGLTVAAQPNPGFVGGRVVVTYTVRNGQNALATGLRLRLGLPAGVPAGPLPAGCGDGVCALGDLVPGESTVVRVVLSPDKALRARITGTLTTTGTDADPRDNTARTTLRILQPEIVAVPNVGKPGFVTSVRGKDFPPGAPVTLTWKPGITAAAPPVVPRADRTFTGQLLILFKDQTGPRTITARGPGFSPVTTTFLVVSGTIGPPDEVVRR
ncbi:hypothetical protein [Streptomyces salyersiae]|uniref:DUF11 domain-containing protein n=1 Tax=Streptomyces salyersiae TaxID=3075530 RepID=A0ABU2RD60_9ACTN|nr:hypothetical protein [Streptomyces sp. DSM 41770]MDT0426744.1 hypothetical protein [Streptomyces sp. DSM 41770]